MWYTYVLHSKKRKLFYVGFTGNLRQRISEHRSSSVTTTARYPDLTLVYYEACLSKIDAISREKQLKTGFGRGYINRRLKDYLGP